MAFNVLGARRAGYTDAEIAEYLAQKSGFNITGAKEAGYEDKEIIAHLNRQDLSFGEAFMAGARAEAGSEIDGIRQIFGGELDPEQVAQENLAQQAYEERGVATTLGRLTGGLLNPSTLLPGSMLFKGWKGAAAAGTLAGGVGGAVRPLYEEDESRLTSGLIGAGAGAVLGGAIGAVASRLSRNAAKVDVDGGDAAPPGAVKGVDEEGNPIIQEGEVETPPASATEPDIKPTIEPDPVVQQEEIFKLPVLPSDLGNIGRIGGRYGQSVVQWESEVDALLYSLGKPGKEKATTYPKLMGEAMRQLKMPEQEVLKMARKVREEVIQTGKQAYREAAEKGEKTVDSFKFNLSKVLDNHYFPVTKGLDDTSKMVYNVGTRFIPDASGKVRANLSDAGFKQVETLMKTLDPNYGTQDAVLAAKGYSIILDTMKSKLGRQFKPRSFEDVFANKLDEDSWRTLFDNGNFDGCP
jgi:hypothetical protein